MTRKRLEDMTQEEIDALSDNEIEELVEYDEHPTHMPANVVEVESDSEQET